MNNKGVVSGVFLYIILIIVGILLIIIFLEIFTPYKFTNLFKVFISKSNSLNVSGYE
ncbi:MAG: hypothetical protein OH338_01995 [Candidatus Parvarchaeota archaeon]|jgi:hypothetical protein|nr:hypothetical protein [Candidatus Parvarchaeota archaeon]MCW1294319.1 hypothetical protein [Candidatus Parvarchaeum tengchongense]MCL5976099.1 hypothetical protein [Candidatus Parvarchaeota archaeon]MCW1295549.1 hypothetical protein [Candidatus Parvarchaeum tengchongense]MCW1298773.1 hypothetical protein [Candidatus Parvarchaeum tengchongense]